MRDVVKGIRTVAANHIETGNFHEFLRRHGSPAGEPDYTESVNNLDLFHIESFDYYDGEYEHEDLPLLQGNGMGDAA